MQGDKLGGCLVWR